MLSHQVHFLETGRHFSVLTKRRLNCSHSWQRGQQALTPPNRSSPLTMLMCSAHINVSSLAPCTHAKADTRMLIHLEDSLHQGHSKVSIHTVDTDVVVLAITAAQRLNISELWLPLELERTSNFLLLMRLPEDLVLVDVLHVMIDIFFGGQVGHLEGVWRCHLSIQCFVFYTNSTNH